MKTLDRSAILYEFVNENIDLFHELRLQILNRIDLKKVLKNKNPYLFAVKNMQTPNDLIRSMLYVFVLSLRREGFRRFFLIAGYFCL